MSRIVLKNGVNRIVIRSSGIRGPQGPAGTSVDDSLLVHISGTEQIIGEKRFNHLGIISSTGKLWLLDVLDTGELITIGTDTTISGVYTTNYEGEY